MEKASEDLIVDATGVRRFDVRLCDPGLDKPDAES
ncbi:unnamed protein product [Penicillium camemberti]|uniref:Str. FM013 n=1 Tax=Penicillium camemberti (strain FM 013) TaxID=1429867 RepID=A0A0G4PWH2_PENC3|nr:unnamed protein product [Penicillium camemberti]